MAVSESGLIRERRRESLITVSFTIFSVFLVYVSMTLGWSPLIVPLLAVEIAFAWWAYLTGFSTYIVRALLVTTLASVSVFFYGTHGVAFYYTLPTLCVFTVLFSLYQERPVLDIVFAFQGLLFLYHALVVHTEILSPDTFERDRQLLGYLSFIVLNVLCLYNVGRHKELEGEIAGLNAQIDKTQKIKDDFVANTSHELRTPINTISGMSEILLQEDLPEKAHNEALDIQMTGIELQTIVTDILDYAALEADTHTLSPRAYNITSTINDVMNMTVFQNREKNLQLIFDCDPRIPCLLYGDEQQLRRVMNNLIGNAIKFTNEGGVVVSVGFRPEEYGINLLVRIKDTGIGMSSESMEKIFQDFYQADPERNRTVEGMGLGLTISSALIKKMGGFLTVRSEEGRGSEFAFSIPQGVRDERPCIAVTHPERVRAIWYFNAEGSESLMRDEYIAHIANISQSLDISVHRASSLGELRRRVKQGKFTHLFIGIDEYHEDPAYFDEVSAQTSTILILDRSSEAPNNRMHTLYTPYNAMTLAELFNGGDILANPRKYQQTRHFEAPGAKVLVVDDNLMNLKVVEGLLRTYRIKITAASSGEEALAQIESADYDFVFMDHMMPGMDGIECFRRIRNKPGEYFATVPIIALTANAIAGSREMFLEEGFDEFVAKPIDNAVLNEVLERFVPDEKKTYLELDQSGRATKGQGQSQPLVPGTPDAPSNDPFDAMEGIDIDTALAYCGGQLDDYIELVRVYCQGSDDTLAQIQGYFDKADWKNYAILVHALKSTSKTIGATRLSELAYTLETASKGEDAATVERTHGPMLDEYRRVLGVLRANPKIFLQQQSEAAAPQADEAPKPPTRLVSLDIAEWRKVSAELREQLATFEADAVEDYVARHADRSYEGRPLGEVLQPVLDKVAAFDFTGAIDELDAIGATK